MTEHPDQHDRHDDLAALLRRAAAGTSHPDEVDRVVRGGVARGRAVRRRRTLRSTLAAVAAVGVIGVTAGVAVGGGAASDRDAVADRATTPTAPPSAPATAAAPEQDDARIAVSAEDVPAVVADLLGGTAGDVRREPPYGVVDDPQRKVVHFSYDGALATFVIERAEGLATCAEQVDPADQPDGEPGGTCQERDGVELLVLEPQTADGVTAQSASAWRQGYVVSAVSYDAAEGKDAAPVSDAPTMSIAQLTDLVTSDVWFGGSEEAGGPEQPTAPDLTLAVTAREVPGVVTAVVPGEVTPSDRVPAYVGGRDQAFASFRLDGREVEAGVALADGDPMTECRRDFGTVDACAEQPDGSVIGLQENVAHGGSTTSRTAWHYGAGYVISVHAWGASGSGVASRIPPPLTAEDLLTLVEPDRWLTGS